MIELYIFVHFMLFILGAFNLKFLGLSICIIVFYMHLAIVDNMMVYMGG